MKRYEKTAVEVERTREHGERYERGYSSAKLKKRIQQHREMCEDAEIGHSEKRWRVSGELAVDHHVEDSVPESEK